MTIITEKKTYRVFSDIDDIRCFNPGEDVFDADYYEKVVLAVRANTIAAQKFQLFGDILDLLCRLGILVAWIFTTIHLYEGRPLQESAAFEFLLAYYGVYWLSHKFANGSWRWQKFRRIAMVKPVNKSVLWNAPFSSLEINTGDEPKQEETVDICVNPVVGGTFYGTYVVCKNPADSTQKYYKLTEITCTHYLIATLCVIVRLPTNFSHPKKVIPSYSGRYATEDDDDAANDGDSAGSPVV